MAKATLPVNYVDDALNSAMDGKRRYKVINNADGTISLEDVTTYDQVGSNFGASQLNTIGKAINESADSGKIIDDIDAIRATTQEGYIAGALALKAVDNSLGGLTFGKDGDGNYGYYGADGSLVPFKSGKLLFAAKFAYSTKDDSNTCYSFSVDGIDKILITGINLRSGTGLYVVPNNNITTDASTTPSISDSIATVISTTPLEVDVSSYDFITLMYYGGDQYITFKVEAL